MGFALTVPGLQKGDEPVPESPQVPEHADRGPVEGAGGGQQQARGNHDGHLDLPERIPCAEGTVTLCWVWPVSRVTMVFGLRLQGHLAGCKTPANTRAWFPPAVEVLPAMAFSCLLKCSCELLRRERERADMGFFRQLADFRRLRGPTGHF